jgi:hopanoid biosynthesis associated protein HpnK
MLEGLSAEAAYFALALAAFVEGEAVMIAAGALAQAGQLYWPAVIVAGAAGSFAWGQTWFTLGRWLGPRLLARFPAWEPRAAVVKNWLLRWGTWVVVGGRFAAGMGTVLPAVIGASGFRRGRFVLLDGVGAFLWSAVLTAVGLGAARGVERIVGRPLGYRVALVVLAVLATFFVLARWLWRPAAKNAPSESNRASLRPERRVIVTGDDFGLALPFNEAIELAYREGVLTTASLMLGEAASSDAVLRARRNPGLCVGLHLALCEARPVSPAAEIPRLVDERRELHAPLVALVRFCALPFSRAFRRELETEIRAQFSAFAATGLRLDHVSGHNNMHLHPAVLPIFVRVARQFGASAIRVPYEPLVASVRASPTSVVARFCVWAVMGAWATWARRRLVAEGFRVNDHVFGIFDCGSMKLERMLGVLRNLPPGSNEIHVHPATRRCPEIERATPSYEHEAELAALLAPELRRAIDAEGVRLVRGYRELAGVEASSVTRDDGSEHGDLLVRQGTSKP